MKNFNGGPVKWRVSMVCEDLGWDWLVMGGKDCKGVPVKGEARKVRC